MALKSALAFSVAVPIANFMAILVCALLTTGLRLGFTPELVAQAFRIIANLFSLGWLIIFLIAAVVSFCAWLIIQRANSTSGALRLILMGSATLVAAILPSLLALIVFKMATGLAIVAATSLAAVALYSRNNGNKPLQVSAAPPSNPRMSFGKRDQ